MLLLYYQQICPLKNIRARTFLLDWCLSTSLEVHALCNKTYGLNLPNQLFLNTCLKDINQVQRNSCDTPRENSDHTWTMTMSDANPVCKSVPIFECKWVLN